MVINSLGHKKGDVRSSDGLLFWGYGPSYKNGEYWVSGDKFAHKLEVARVRYRTHRTDVLASCKKRYQAIKQNPEKYEQVLLRVREYAKAHPGVGIASKNKRWLKNRDYQREYHRSRRAVDICFRVKGALQSRMTNALTGNYKSCSTEELTGCKISELKTYLEAMFSDGMSWKNYGRMPGRWSIDHIRPCNSFDLSVPEQQEQCFNFRNLRPMWHLDNIRKGCHFSLDKSA